MDEIAVGLIGCGEHALQDLLPSLVLEPGVRLVGTCDSDLRRAEAAANLARHARAYRTAEKLLAVKHLDAVVMACPPQIHSAIARNALSAGIHVFAEKPPATSTEELTAIANMARQKGLITAVGHNFRFADAFQVAKAKLNDPAFGRSRCIQITYLVSGPRGSRWGLEPAHSFLLSHAIHAIDLFHFFCGTTHSSSSRMVEGRDGSIDLLAQLEFDNGCIGHLTSTSCARTFSIRATVVGDGGAVVTIDGLRSVVASGFTREKRWRNVWKPKVLQSERSFAGYGKELEVFFRGVREGTGMSPSFDDELATYTVIDEIQRQRSQN